MSGVRQNTYCLQSVSLKALLEGSQGRKDNIIIHNVSCRHVTGVRNQICQTEYFGHWMHLHVADAVVRAFSLIVYVYVYVYVCVRASYEARFSKVLP